MRTDVKLVKVSVARLGARVDRLGNRISHLGMQRYDASRRTGVSRQRKSHFEPGMSRLGTEMTRLYAQKRQLSRDREQLHARVAHLEDRITQVLAKGYGAVTTAAPVRSRPGHDVGSPCVR